MNRFIEVQTVPTANGNHKVAINTNWIESVYTNQDGQTVITSAVLPANRYEPYRWTVKESKEDVMAMLR